MKKEAPGRTHPEIDSNVQAARAFVLLRFTLIIASAYLLFAQVDFGALPPIVNWLIGAALLSNFALLKLSFRGVLSTASTSFVLLADTIWITLALSLTGNFGEDMFFLYFFLIFLAAIGQRLELIVIGAAIVLGVYVYSIVASGGADELLTAESLTRVPFLLTVAVFNGHLVERVRREKRRASEEARAAIRSRDDQQRLLEDAAELERAYADLNKEVEERERAQQEQKSAQRDLRKVNERLENVSLMKSLFLANASHELRTPLSAIKTSLDLVRMGKAGPLEAEQVQFLDVSARNIDRLVGIVNDLLDLSKAEDGKLEFRFSEVDSERLLEESLRTFGPQARAREIRFDIDPPEAPVAVMSDPERIAQVLSNLISNALKATDPGGHVGLKARSCGDWVRFDVTDSGSGISKEDQSRIFEPFYQCELSTQSGKGTGLGLSIARELLAAHGSSLELKSEPGLGCRFSFELPAFSPMAREIIELESEVRHYRQRGFGLLVIESGRNGAEAGAESDELVLRRIGDRIKQSTARSSDHLYLQRLHGRVVYVLTGTERAGASVVKQRVVALFSDPLYLGRRDLPSPSSIHGPAMFPEDGFCCRDLIDQVLADSHPHAIERRVAG